MTRSIRALLRRVRRAEGGQSLVEFALLAPVLMIFIVGVVDFGNMLFTYQVITNAAREGARRAAVFDEAVTDSVVRAAITESLTPLSVDAGDYSWVTVAPEDDGTCDMSGSMGGGTAGKLLIYECGWSGARNTDAVVAIEYDYQTVLLGAFLGHGGNTYPLSTKMVYRNE